MALKAHSQPRSSRSSDRQGEQAGVEAGEEEQVSADAGGKLIVGSFAVEGEQELSGRAAGFGEDEDVDFVFVSEITDVAGEIATVEIPEEEARHRNNSG